MSATSCPSTGSGVHRWLPSQANRCRWCGLVPQAAAAALLDATIAPAGQIKTVPCGRGHRISAAEAKQVLEQGVPA